MSKPGPKPAHVLAEASKKALQLRLAGSTFPEIAAVLGVSISTAHSYYKRAVTDIPKEEADQLREIETARLDALQRTYWELALTGDIEAAKIVLKVIDRRCKLLGLDKPAQVEVSTQVDVDLDATVTKLMKVAELSVLESVSGG